MRMPVQQAGEVRLEAKASMGSQMEGLAQEGLMARQARCGLEGGGGCCCGLQQKHKDGNMSNEEIPGKERGQGGRYHSGSSVNLDPFGCPPKSHAFPKFG
ncbi:hypothetical protein AOLI_G00305560 [Acnodon oligacanthus]